MSPLYTFIPLICQVILINYDSFLYKTLNKKNDRESLLEEIFGDEGLINADDIVCFEIKCSEIEERVKALSLCDCLPPGIVLCPPKHVISP
jgi:hypothetical protein